jgi:exopolysaccharide biosynthesis polyprenyl glycosylphosphotransferase
MSKPQFINMPLRSQAEPYPTVSPADERARFRAWRDPLRRRMLALADVFALVAGCVFLGVVFDSDLETAAWALLITPLWIVVAKLYGLYDRDHTALRHLTVDELPSLVFWTLTVAAGTALLLHVTPAGGPTFEQGARFWIATAIAAFALRALARFSWRRLTPPERVLILGDGGVADATRRKLKLFPDIHATAVDDGVTRIADFLGNGASGDIDRVVVATESLNQPMLAELVNCCRRERTKLSVVPPAQAMLGSAMRISRVADLPVLDYNTWDASRSTLLLKRAMDVLVAAVGLVVLMPGLLVIALLVVIDSRGPVLFSQVRAGLHGRPFRMFKFRTMSRDAEARLPQLVAFDSLDEPVFKLHGDPRVTRVGRLLRRTSLDELPQLVNVLKGDMSLVGPRPEQVELVDRYTPDECIRLSVKPGMTGPMQVYGRAQLRFDERLAVEREYVENISIGRDLRILWLTIEAVATGRGAY